jgi:hypothetical protein
MALGAALMAQGLIMDNFPDLDRKTVTEFFFIDYKGQVRFTHYPSQDTCLMQPAQVSSPSGRADWNAQFKAFRERHPEANLVATYSNKIVDDIRSHPNVGQGFQVGDDVVVVNGGGELELHTIVEAVPITPFTSASLVDHEFRLEDGTRLHWSDIHQEWVADKQTPWSHSSRARMPLADEVLPRYETPHGIRV